jgi:histidyl-tRNA synthetase
MFELASRLRNAGISAELYLGSRYAFREQIKYAASRGIPYLLIQGEDERNRGTVSLRDLSSREQYECSLDEAISRLIS